MHFKRQSRSSLDINLTPLIDVVFLLLIFFMVSTSFTSESHLTLTLPEAVYAEKSPDDRPRLDVVVDKNGFYRVAEQALVDTRPETLASALRNLSEENFKLPIEITADAVAPYQAVVQVIDIAGELGFVQINLTTQPKTDKPVR
jgi:biopolymer transport protein ExbD